MSELIQAVSDQNFEAEVLHAEIPVLLDFWAPWCGPCRAIAPILDELAGVYQSRVKIVKMNVDENPQTPAKFNVRGIPTLILFKNGQAFSTHVGLGNKQQLSQLIDSVLS